MQSVIISNIKDNAYMADVTFPIENNKLTAILIDIEIPYILSLIHIYTLIILTYDF